MPPDFVGVFTRLWGDRSTEGGVQPGGKPLEAFARLDVHSLDSSLYSRDLGFSTERD